MKKFTVGDVVLAAIVFVGTVLIAGDLVYCEEKETDQTSQIYQELKDIRALIEKQETRIERLYQALEPSLKELEERAERLRKQAGEDAALAMEEVFHREDGSFLGVLLFLPGTHRLVLAYRDNTLQLVDIPSGETTTLSGLDSEAQCLAATADGRTLFAGTSGGSVYLWRLDNTTVHAVKVTDTEGWPVSSIAASPDGSRVAWVTNGKPGKEKKWDDLEDGLVLVDVKTRGKLFSFHVGRGDFHAVSFSPDGNSLAVVHNGDVALVDATTGKASTALKSEQCPSGPLTVAYSRKGSLVAAGYAPNDVAIWDAKNGTCLRFLNAHSNWVVALDFTSDDTRLVSSAGDSTASVWNVSSGSEIGRLRFGEGYTYINDVSVSSDDRYVAIARRQEYVVCLMPPLSPKGDAK